MDVMEELEKAEKRLKELTEEFRVANAAVQKIALEGIALEARVEVLRQLGDSRGNV